MWRDRLEAFWDGGTSLAFGFFGVSDIPSLIAPRYEFLVASCASDDFRNGVTLLDLIDIRASPSRFWVVTLPPRHVYVAIRVREGESLLLRLVREGEVSGGEWRLLLTELPQAGRVSDFFRIVAVAANADPDRFAREQIQRSGDRLVWALRQRRQVEHLERVPAAMRISPSRRIWPTRESSVTIEAVDPGVTPRSPTRPVRFALLDLWQREKPPRVAMRIRVSGTGDDINAALQRMVVVHVMNQRRHLRDWIKTNRESGDPIIHPLTFEDVRNALHDPHELPYAVDAPSWWALFPLSEALKFKEKTEKDGAIITPLPRTASAAGGVGIEFEFFGAALGDDVGIVSNWARDGDIAVYSGDPGGSQKARLLRVGIDGLTPQTLDDADPMLRELLARAADHEAEIVHEPGGFQESETSDRQAAFLSHMRKLVRNGTLIATVDAQTRWDDLTPLTIAAFASLAASGGPTAEDVLQRLGGFATFRLDPVVASVAARRSDLIADIPSTVLAEHHDTSGHLARRLGVMRGTADLVAQNPDLFQQTQAWRILTEAGMAQQLTAARISLQGSAAVMASASSIVASLIDESIVERAADSQEDRDAPDEAEALRAYLRTRHGLDKWTTLEEAEPLSRLVNDARSHWTDLSEGGTKPAPEPATGADRRKPPQLRADIEALFERIRAMDPPPPELARREMLYRDHILPGKPDRYVLREFEAQLIRLEEAPANNKLVDSCLSVLENWAGLPDFLRSIEPRLNRGAIPGSNGRSAILTHYVNRTYPSLPRRNASARATALDVRRDALANAISNHLGIAGHNRGAEANLAKDVLAFADILFFHQGFKAIERLLQNEVSEMLPQSEIRRLKDGLARWPRSAAKNWDDATSIVREHAPAYLQALETTVAPPEF